MAKNIQAENVLEAFRSYRNWLEFTGTRDAQRLTIMQRATHTRTGKMVDTWCVYFIEKDYRTVRVPGLDDLGGNLQAYKTIQAMRDSLQYVKRHYVHDADSVKPGPSDRPQLDSSMG